MLVSVTDRDYFHRGRRTVYRLRILRILPALLSAENNQLRR